MCVHIYRGTAGVLKTGAPRQAWLWQERGEFVPLRDTVNLDSVGGDSAKAGHLEGAGWFLQLVAGGAAMPQ